MPKRSLDGLLLLAAAGEIHGKKPIAMSDGDWENIRHKLTFLQYIVSWNTTVMRKKGESNFTKDFMGFFDFSPERLVWINRLVLFLLNWKSIVILNDKQYILCLNNIVSCILADDSDLYMMVQSKMHTVLKILLKRQNSQSFEDLKPTSRNDWIIFYWIILQFINFNKLREIVNEARGIYEIDPKRIKIS